MKKSKPAIFIALLSGIAVVAIATLRLGKTAPGPLAAVHARVPELAAWRSCAQCHGGLFGSMTASCLACHEVIEQQLADGSGLHGAVARRDGDEVARHCATCHSEHHGESFAMVHQGSFARAGIADPEAFDHVLIGFELAGTHLDLVCRDCHVNADAGVLPEGGKRFLGLDRDCASCHEDPHGGRMDRRCVECHVQTGFEKPRATWHDRNLRLVGGHADVECRACHEGGSGHALEDYAKGELPTRACADCHESPHREPFLVGNAKLSGGGPASVASGCVLCHQPEHTSFRDERLVVTREQHASSGFVLDGPHMTVACNQCHDSELASHALRHPGRTQDSCQACHDDPHGGQFANAGNATDCRSCHLRHAFTPHAFDATRHASTKFALTGMHAQAKCEACHRVGENGIRRFHETNRRCDDCHADAHAGFFTKVDSTILDKDAGTCAECHGTDGFGAGTRDAFDHERWTGFALKGAHAQERCESCHARANLADETGRTFGRCRESFGDIPDAGRSCIPCHSDPHGGAFDDPKLPASVDGRRACARCHDETSFRALAREFDHAAWTGFELDGQHSKLACSSCHDGTLHRVASDRGRAVSWGHAAGRACADCHTDPHAEQFAVLDATDCAKCHRPTLGFGDLVFNHEIHSRFKLGESHRGLACSACHRTERKGDTEFVRYKPMGRACSDCHETRPRPFRRRTSK
ncbi:MAG: hypothetical protein H6833_13260 [Planctomycetes bacterium]|nr:hypothetical protein [Planctomycetota bacterium]